ncbi:MAG: hypothetical protein AAB426_11660 [Myxococcota bacterium]
MSVITDRRKLVELSQSLPADQRAHVDVASLLTLAAHAAQRRELEHAANILQGVLVVDPDHVGAWTLLGQVEQQLGEGEPAAEAYATALMLDDADLDTAMTLAELHAAAGRTGSARALLDWLVLEVDDAPELLERARVLAAKLAEVAP